MAKILGVYQKNIHMRKIGARQSLEDFHASREKIVKRILEVNGQLIIWLS